MKKILSILNHLSTITLVLFSFFVFSAHAQMPEMSLTLGAQTINVEVAASNPDRMKGLMFRRIMPENRGMLFVFPEINTEAMWMENTFIPLSVAFIDEAGVITNIEDMKPHTRDSHASKSPVRYALEMNLGWFAKHGIKAGSKILGLGKAPPAH